MPPPSDRFPVPLRAFSSSPALLERLHQLGTTRYATFDAGPVPDEPAALPPEADLLVVDAAAGSIALLDAFHQDLATVVVVTGPDEPTPDDLVDLLGRGAEDVLDAAEWAADSLPRRLAAAVERKRLERLARTDYATDLDTGLPHQQQLIEHMSQLLALREREPAPMAVLALRIEGVANAEARLGREPANVLRRKVGVRLRAGVRASDVVASLGDDCYAVLLGSVLTPADAERVGAKLLRALVDPFKLSGEDVPVAAALGIGRYPEDGSQPEALLRRAVGLAASAQASGQAGFARFAGPADAGGGAANDET